MIFDVSLRNAQCNSVTLEIEPFPVPAPGMLNYWPIIESTRTQQQPTRVRHLLLFGLCEAASEVEEEDEEERDVPATEVTTALR